MDAKTLQEIPTIKTEAPEGKPPTRVRIDVETHMSGRLGFPSVWFAVAIVSLGLDDSPHGAVLYKSRRALDSRVSAWAHAKAIAKKRGWLVLGSLPVTTVTK